MSRKSGKQTKQEKTKEVDQLQEESSPYDGLIGELAADYVTVCERNGVIPLEVQVNAPRIGPYINVVSRENGEPGTVDELHIADAKLPAEHIEPLQLSLDVVPSPLETVKILRVPLCSQLLQGLTTIAMKKNLRKLTLDGCQLPNSLSPLFSAPVLYLSLKQCSLTDAHCVSIGKGLTRNLHLTGLSLACNQIGDSGLKEIVKGLRVNRSLLLLSLTNNRISDSGAASLAEMLTDFELSHEEVVTRRQLLLGSRREDGLGVDYDLSAGQLTPRMSLSVHSPDKAGRSSKLEKGKPQGKKDSGKKEDKGKKDDSKTKRNSLDRKAGKGKDSKMGKKAVADQPPDTPPLQEVLKIVNPLLEHVIEGSSPLRMTGNHVLVSLSLAYNHLTDKGVRLLMTAMSKQDVSSDRGQGLLRLSVKNSLVTSDCLSELEKILASRDPLQTKKEDKVIPEEQTADDSVQ